MTERCSLAQFAFWKQVHKKMMSIMEAKRNCRWLGSWLEKASLRRHHLSRYFNNSLWILRRNIADEKRSQCEGPETQCAWQVGGRTKRTMCLDRSKLREISRRYAWRNNNGGI